MRQTLNFIYNAAGVLAGFCILAITLLILAQSISRWFGVILPSTEDFSGYLLAASSFLGLAYTFRHGVHIRVNLVYKRFAEPTRHKLEIVVLLIGMLMCGFMSYYMGVMVYESYIFEELSHGYIAIPMWIPQTAPLVGLVIFTVALLDDLLVHLFGGTASYLVAEETETMEILTEEGC